MCINIRQLQCQMHSKRGEFSSTFKNLTRSVANKKRRVSQHQFSDLYNMEKK